MSTAARPAVLPSRPCRVCSAPVFADQRFCGECGAGVALDVLLDDSDADVAVADPLVGRVVADRYRILRCIGRGGMGVVYAVEHVHIGKRLAMKLLHGELAGDAGTLRRLRHEAEAASRLSDSATVQVFDFGQSDGLAYLVMELVDGEDLGQILRREGRMPFARIARLVLDVCSSLAEAHELGIVHRDLKPENVMILSGSSGERAKVLDFGLAVLRANAQASVSRTGSIVGTPYYMAPEQIRGEEVDARADVYALGGLLYRAVTGLPPYAGESAIVVLTQHLTDKLVPPSARVEGVEPGVDAIVTRCMAKSPRDRYAGVAELGVALSEWLAAQGLADGRRKESTVSTRLEAIATRRDIDDYESRLRRRSQLEQLGLGLGALAVVGAVVLGVLHATAPPDAPTQEIEPNSEPASATKLVAGTDVCGHLGRRLDRERGDVDVYRLALPPGFEGAVRASVSGLPNLDVVLELYHEGEQDPLLRVDASGVGRGEGFAGFPIDGGSHLLVVRERWIRGTYPTENVSDPYVIRWSPMPSDEGELDDTIVSARTITPGQVLRGHFGWPSDVDVVCAPPDVASGRFTVTPGVGIDLALAPLDARNVAGTPIDAAREGGPETFVLRAGEGRCMRLSRVEPGRDVDRPAEATYGLIFVRD